jgi:hypothetical protein
MIIITSECGHYTYICCYITLHCATTIIALYGYDRCFPYCVPSPFLSSPLLCAGNLVLPIKSIIHISLVKTAYTNSIMTILLYIAVNSIRK